MRDTHSDIALNTGFWFQILCGSTTSLSFNSKSGMESLGSRLYFGKAFWFVCVLTVTATYVQLHSQATPGFGSGLGTRLMYVHDYRSYSSIIVPRLRASIGVACSYSSYSFMRSCAPKCKVGTCSLTMTGSVQPYQSNFMLLGLD